MVGQGISRPLFLSDLAESRTALRPFALRPKVHEAAPKDEPRAVRIGIALDVALVFRHCAESFGVVGSSPIARSKKWGVGFLAFRAKSLRLNLYFRQAVA